jgi:hypothetical protein
MKGSKPVRAGGSADGRAGDAAGEQSVARVVWAHAPPAAPTTSRKRLLAKKRVELKSEILRRVWWEGRALRLCQAEDLEERVGEVGRGFALEEL